MSLLATSLDDSTDNELPAKTIFIYLQEGYEVLQFFILDGDYSHLNHTYVNTGGDESKETELVAIIENKPTMFHDFPSEEITKSYCEVFAVCVGWC